MSDDEILHKIGLSAPALQDFEQKYDAFVSGLSDDQRAAFLKTQKTVEQGARELDKDVTPDRLNKLLRKGTETLSLTYVCVFCLNNGDTKHHR